MNASSIARGFSDIWDDRVNAGRTEPHHLASPRMDPEGRTRAAQRQFEGAAQAYLASRSHAQGEDLAKLVALAAPQPADVALDLGCGVGHTLRRIAPHVRLAVGADVTVGMLEGARSLLMQEGITSAMLVVAPAERLPFLDATFDLVTCRLAAHHFGDAAAAFREIGRVMRPGGRFLLADNYAPDDADLDRFVNTLEALRDSSHVREHTIAGWRELLASAGLASTDEWRTTLRIDRERWLAQSRTPHENAERVREMLRTADERTRRAFQIDESGFSNLKVVLRAEQRR
jgi:ubiquinone/menaquinone biosynthesis C-methylase UbiE